MDTDKSGTVTYAEFSKWWDRHNLFCPKEGPMARSKITPSVVDACTRLLSAEDPGLPAELVAHIVEESSAAMLHDEVREAFVSARLGTVVCRYDDASTHWQFTHDACQLLCAESIVPRALHG